MITSLNIHNFRCFRDLTIEPLARVNLLVGANNCGKTSVLEALFLHSAPDGAAAPVHLVAYRGLTDLAASSEELWGWLWPWADVAEPSKIECAYADGSRLTHEMVETAASPVEDLSAAMQARDASATLNGATVVVRRALHRRYVEMADEGFSSIELTGGEPRLLSHQRASVVPFWFVTAAQRSDPRDVRAFSELARTRDAAAVVAALRVLEPRLEGLDLLMIGRNPTIHADLGTGKLMPLNYLGDGAVRLASVLLALGSSRGGLILIDEIDSGLHYSVQEKVWQAILTAAREYDVQVFATTHSLECVHAAQRAFAASDPSALLVHRIERNGDEARVVTIDCETVGGMGELGFEVR